MHNKKLLDELASRLSSALPFAREVSGELRTKIEQRIVCWPCNTTSQCTGRTNSAVPAPHRIFLDTGNEVRALSILSGMRSRASAPGCDVRYTSHAPLSVSF